MATLYITEYVNVLGDEPALAEQTVKIPGVSKPLNPQTKSVRLHTDTTCSIVFGQDGKDEKGKVVELKATVSNQRLAANQTERKTVAGTHAFKIAVIGNA